MAEVPDDPLAETVAPTAPAAPAVIDAVGLTVRRSAVTDTVVPSEIADTMAPSGPVRRVRRSAVEDTVLPPAALDTVLPAGTDDTVAAASQTGTSSSSRPPSSSHDPAAAGSATTFVRADPGATTVRTVGDELRAASVEQFGEVDADRYDILDELARGGLGKVLRARDPRTGRIVAIKQVLRPNRELIVRFAREALVTANLQHPAIVPVYEVGRWHSGEPFYAMKLVRGRALDALIAEATTSPARVALVPHVIAIADALAYAHSEHVIHRDLKPANVLVGPYGETVVIDWGLARNLASDDDPAAPSEATAGPGETVAGAVMGTPAYMAPEQAAGQPLDERADVYAIGAILYHVLAGVRPYDEATTVDRILAAVTSGPPRPLAAIAPEVAPELIAIADQAMARDRDARYPTALGLAEDLRRFQAGQLVGAHRYSSRELIRRWLRRHRAVAITAAVAALALAGFGVLSVRRIAAERDRAQQQTAVATRERADARDARALAERRLGASLEELGRLAAEDGAPERALPFLTGAAAAIDPPSPALAVLVGQARLAYGGLTAVAPIDEGGTRSADLAADGRTLITSSVNGLVHAWDLVDARERWMVQHLGASAVAPDGERLVTITPAGETTLRAVDDGHVLATWRPPTAWAASDVPATLVWSPTGDRFAIGTSLGRILVGGPGGGALVEGEPHHGEVWSLRFAPDGGALASVAADGVLAVRDPGTAAIRTRLAEPGVSAIGCAWRDPRTLISVDGDRQARLWRVADGAVLHRYPHPYDLYGVAVSPDGTRMAAFGDGELVTLWAVDGEQPGIGLHGHRLGVDLAVFVGGRLVTSDEMGGVRAWDTVTGELASTLPPERLVHGLTVRGDQVVVFGEGRTRRWRPDIDQALRRLYGHQARIREVAFDATGRVLWSASHDGSARGVELATGAVRTLGTADFAEPDLVDAAQAPAQATINPHGLRSISLAPDGTRAFTAVEDGTIGVWDQATGAALATWRGHHGRVRRVIVTDAGRTAYSVGDTTLRRWDVATGQETGRAELAGVGWDVIELGDRLATLTDTPRHLELWDIATLAPIAIRPFTDDKLRSLVVADLHLVVATGDQVLLLDRDGALVATAAHAGSFAAAVGMAGPVPAFAVGDGHGDVVLHDRATLAPIRSFDTGERIVAALAFRPDGAILATAGGRRVQLWDPATGVALARSPEVPALVSQLTWSPDGRQLAFAGGAGTVWVWRVPTDGSAGLADFTACASPLRLDDSVLTANEFEPARCHGLPRP